MARVRGLTKETRLLYQSENLAKDLKEVLYQNHISHREVGELIGITGQAVGYQLNNNKVTVPLLMAVATLVDIPENKIKKMLSLE